MWIDTILSGFEVFILSLVYSNDLKWFLTYPRSPLSEHHKPDGRVSGGAQPLPRHGVRARRAAQPHPQLGQEDPPRRPHRLGHPGEGNDKLCCLS